MITKISYENKNLTIIGTAHISIKSREIVKKTIDEEKPDVVGVELDIKRFKSILNKDNEKDLKFSYIFRSRRPILFLIYYILQKFQKKIAKKFKTKPGAEMIQGIISAKENNSKLLLLDRDAEFTISKILKNLTFREKLKILFGGFSLKKELGKDFNIDTILKSVDDEKEFNKIDKILNIFMKKHKKLKKILIDERDQFMAYNIRETLKRPEVNSMVVVVGAGHVKGMLKEIYNDKIDVKKLLNIKLEK
jgi:pheromone shutdown-related protein TraB